METWDGDAAKLALSRWTGCRVDLVKYVASLSRFVLSMHRGPGEGVAYVVLVGCSAYYGALRWDSAKLEFLGDRLVDESAGVTIVGNGLVVVELAAGETPPELLMERSFSETEDDDLDG